MNTVQPPSAATVAGDAAALTTAAPRTDPAAPADAAPPVSGVPGSPAVPAPAPSCAPRAASDTFGASCASTASGTPSASTASGTPSASTASGVPGTARAAGDSGTADPSAEPRWLTDDEQEVWRAYLHATQLLEDHLDRQLQRDAGMPHIYYGLLVKLAEAPDQRLRMTELAMEAKITRSRLSHAVSRLEKSGWVRREDCPTDRRGQFAVLTEEGAETLRRSAPGHVTTVRRAVFDRLTPKQQKSLGEIMKIVAEGLEPDEAGADLPWLR